MKQAVMFKEIRVQAPFGVLKLLPGKKSNIDDILTKLSQPKHTPEKKDGLPPVIISKLQVMDGKLSVDDLVGTEPVHDTLFPITFTLENLSTLMGVMGDIISSPFSVIKAIDGFKGEELRFIEFEFGLSELSAQVRQKLNTLAKFLNERIALKIGIEGSADRQMDWASLSGRQAKKGKQGNGQKAVRAQQEDLANSQNVDDNQLKQLARMRAEQVKSYLTQQIRVDEGRVQLKPVQIKSTPNENYGRVELFLSAQ